MVDTNLFDIPITNTRTHGLNIWLTSRQCEYTGQNHSHIRSEYLCHRELVPVVMSYDGAMYMISFLCRGSKILILISTSIVLHVSQQASK